MVGSQTCNYRRGQKSCPKSCLQSSDGTFKAKCSYHLNAANRKSRKALAKRKALLSEDPAADEAAKRGKARLRMQKCREERKLLINDNENENVRRMARLLNTIKNSQEYVIVPNVISSPIVISDIKLQGKRELIDFGKKKQLRWTRTMQALESPEDILSDVLSALKIVFSKCVHIVVKLLTSIAGDTEQVTHRDFRNDDQPLTTLSEFNYSAIKCLEENTRLLVGKLRVSIDIPLYSMLIFRGDMFHAGAAYSVENKRLFISASCDKFPVTRNVHLEK